MNKLLSADPTRLGCPDVPPASDAVEESLMGGTPEKLKTDLIAIFGEELVRSRILDLVRYASDASRADSLRSWHHSWTHQRSTETSRTPHGARSRELYRRDHWRGAGQ